MHSKGHFIIVDMEELELVGKKIAATLTGTPDFWSSGRSNP